MWFVYVLCGAISEKKAVKSLFASDSQNSDNADELLGLCSGQFSGGGATWREPSTVDGTHRGLYTPDSTNNECLLDVLSGRFTSTQASQDAHDATRSASWISMTFSFYHTIVTCHVTFYLFYYSAILATTSINACLLSVE